MTQIRKLASAAVAVLMIAFAANAVAQINTDRPLYPGGEVNANPADLGSGVPRDDVIEAMAKNALMTLNDANLTGNYDVFRARLHATFRQQKTAVELAAIFAGFRSAKIDLAPALVHRAIFAEAPHIDAEGKLRAKGFFETRPWRTSFDLDWARDGKAWALMRINVQARPPDQ